MLPDIEALYRDDMPPGELNRQHIGPAIGNRGNNEQNNHFDDHVQRFWCNLMGAIKDFGFQTTGNTSLPVNSTRQEQTNDHHTQHKLGSMKAVLFGIVFNGADRASYHTANLENRIWLKDLKYLKTTTRHNGRNRTHKDPLIEQTTKSLALALHAAQPQITYPIPQDLVGLNAHRQRYRIETESRARVRGVRGRNRHNNNNSNINNIVQGDEMGHIAEGDGQDEASVGDNGIRNTTISPSFFQVGKIDGVYELRSAVFVYRPTPALLAYDPD